MTETTPTDRELRDAHLDHLRAATDESRAHLRHMDANIEVMRSQREQWQIENRRETRRLVLYGGLVAAALLAAGGTAGGALVAWLARTAGAP